MRAASKAIKLLWKRSGTLMSLKLWITTLTEPETVALAVRWAKNKRGVK